MLILDNNNNNNNVTYMEQVHTAICQRQTEMFSAYCWLLWPETELN